MRRPRTADVARAAFGTVLLVRPDVAVRATGAPDDRPTRLVVRVLAARYVVQAAAGVVVRRRWVRAADSAVDVVHALTTLGLAERFPEHRRMALTSGALAVAFAALDVTEETR